MKTYLKYQNLERLLLTQKEDQRSVSTNSKQSKKTDTHKKRKQTRNNVVWMCSRGSTDIQKKGKNNEKGRRGKGERMKDSRL